MRRREQAKHGRWALVVALILGGLFLAGVARAAGEGAEAAVQVRVVPLAEVMGPQFTLGEVAELDGADMQRIQQLATAPLGRSPRAGQKMSLNPSLLQARLARLVDLTGVEFQVPRGATVARAFQTVPAVEVERVVLEEAARLAGNSPDALRQEMLGVQKDIIVPMGEVSWDISPVGSALTMGGTRSFRVVARVGDEEGWRGLVRIKQSVSTEIVVAKRAILRNALITEADVTLERADVARMRPESYLTDLRAVVGTRAQRPIGAGEWLAPGLVRATLDIKEGGRVTVVYSSASLNLRTPGVAMNPGRVGDFIPVRNLQSGRIVYGIIQADDTVKVN